MNCKEQSQGSNSLLSSRQVVHGSEPLPWSHTVVVDSIQIGLLGILWAKESLQEADVERFPLLYITFNTMQKLQRTKQIPGHCCCVRAPYRSHRCLWPPTRNKY